MPDTASVAEESGSVQVCATLSDVPAGGYVAIDIMLATSDGMIVIFSVHEVNFSSLGSAVAGSDYAAVSSPLTFPATTSTDDVMQCIDVNITDNFEFEESETFTVTVTTTNPRVTLGNNDTTITIIGQFDT